MGIITSVAGWLLKQVAGTVVGRLTNRALDRSGIFDATCERCRTMQSSVAVPEGRVFSLTCPNCGHSGSIYIESLASLIIHQVRQANIMIDQATIMVRNVQEAESASQQSQGVRASGSGTEISVRVTDPRVCTRTGYGWGTPLREFHKCKVWEQGGKSWSESSRWSGRWSWDYLNWLERQTSVPSSDEAFVHCRMASYAEGKDQSGKLYLLFSTRTLENQANHHGPPEMIPFDGHTIYCAYPMEGEEKGRWDRIRGFIETDRP